MMTETARALEVETNQYNKIKDCRKTTTTTYSNTRKLFAGLTRSEVFSLKTVRWGHITDVESSTAGRSHMSAKNKKSANFNNTKWLLD
jgi:hypothetical protein